MTTVGEHHKRLTEEIVTRAAAHRTPKRTV